MSVKTPIKKRKTNASIPVCGVMVTDRQTVESLPLWYQALAQVLWEKGDLLIIDNSRQKIQTSHEVKTTQKVNHKVPPIKYPKIKV